MITVYCGICGKQYMTDGGGAGCPDCWNRRSLAAGRGEALADMVEHPPHYTQGKVECIDAIESALTAEEFRGYCKGVVIKYCWRESHKGGDEDLKKARWYLNRLEAK
jgi:hypothetical protein